ncbi:FG-GAP repeat domain-containing protein [Longispora urticae]
MLLAVGLMFAAFGLWASSPASATVGPSANVTMPFTGKWAYVSHVNPPYNDVNSSHPSVHHRPGGGDWATDLYAPADNTAVRLNVSGNSGTLSFEWMSSSSSCGQSVRIKVKVDGVSVGWIYVAHLTSAVTSGTITNGMRVGDATNLGCNPSRHIHVEYRNLTAGHACWHDHGSPGVTRAEGTVIGTLGSANTGPAQQCGPGPAPTPSPTPPALPDTLTGTMADINHDGKPDLIGRFADGTARVYHGTGADAFDNGTQFGSGWNIFTAINLADINHDSKPDLIGRLADGTARMYHGLGSDTFDNGAQVGSGWNIFSTVNFADINHDGKPDLIGRLADGTARVYHGTGPDTFDNGTDFGSGWNIFTAVLFADINQDGRPDLVGRLSNGIARVYHGTGADTFDNGTDFGSGWNIFTAINLADINHDGKPDLIGRLADGTARVYHSTGADTFDNGTDFGSGWNIFTAIP